MERAFNYSGFADLVSSFDPELARLDRHPATRWQGHEPAPNPYRLDRPNPRAADAQDEH